MKQGIEPALLDEAQVHGSSAVQHVLDNVFEDELDDDSMLSKFTRYKEVRAGVRPVVDTPAFTFISSIVVMLNALLIGAQTDYIVRHRGAVPILYEICDASFCAFFSIELLCRLKFYGCTNFFTGDHWQWNVFDFIIVLLQASDVVVHAYLDVNGDEQRPDMVAFAMRSLRLLRIMRILRVLRLVQELQMIVSSIMGSMKSLFWTLAFLILLTFSCGVCVTQAVGEHFIISGIDANESNIKTDDLKYYYGSLLRSILTLYESITSGLSWDSAVEPLIEDVSPLAALFFCAYITFVVFAVMNAVTGVFCEKAMKNVVAEEEEFLANTCRKNFEKQIFKSKNDRRDPTISWEEFESQLHSKEVREYFRAIDVCVSEAEGLFGMLDKDNHGRIHFEQFMRGLLKLRGNAKSLDLTLLMTETDEMYKKISDHMEIVERRLTILCDGVPNQGSGLRVK